MKKIAILGSSGSIGRQTIDVIKHHPDKFKIIALAVNSNTEILAEQISELNPLAVAVNTEAQAEIIKNKFPNLKIYSGDNALTELVQLPEIDIVVSAVTGASGILPVLKAIECGKKIALANKETLVVTGDLINQALKKYSGQFLPPIDSEHSAIFQCLNGENSKNIHKIIITCSGGAFKNHSEQELKTVTAQDALKHPTWNMGNKITIDSATLMNKGFEVIEAQKIFNIPYDNIEVVIHPESIIHSMVEFVDGSIMAQTGAPDMRMPIQYSLSHPDRLPNNFARLNFKQLNSLTFRQPNTDLFPCLTYAIQAGKTGGTMPAVLNASNEICVQAFLDNKIRFLDIAKIIKQTMDEHQLITDPNLEQILETDKWARNKAKELVDLNSL